MSEEFCQNFELGKMDYLPIGHINYSNIGATESELSELKKL